MVILPQDPFIDVRILKQMLTESLSASYKLFWFSGIFEEINRGNQIISFRRIVCRMITSAWYPSLEYHLNFGANDKLYDTVILIHKKFGIESNVRSDELLTFLEELNDKEVEKAISNFYNMVPYRLLVPFFKKSDFRGMTDTKRHRHIAEVSNTREDIFYKIDRSNKNISINNEWYDYIKKNSPIVQGWMNYEIINYMQKRNPNVPAIPFKLSPPYQRNLNSAKKFWQEVNKLPNLELYIDKFCDLQYHAFTIMRKNKAFRKDLQDYLTINKKMDITSLKHHNVPREQFVDSMKSTIKPLFQIAYNQGYDLWRTEDESEKHIITSSYTTGQSLNI